MLQLHRIAPELFWAKDPIASFAVGEKTINYNKLMSYPNSLEDLEGFWPSAPEPSGISSAICTGTLRNLISHLDRNPPLHHLSAPEPSGTSSAICTGTLRNFISHLHRTLRNLLQNLVLQLHRIAPELFWAKDPIASFAVGEKNNKLMCYPQQFGRS